MAPAGRKLEVRVVMCCQGCVDNVEEILNETHGVLNFEIERYKSLVTVTETPSRGPNHKELVKKLKKKTHEKTAEILREIEAPSGGSRDSTRSTTHIVYMGNPNMGPGYHPVPVPVPVPWPATITNPNYFKHPIRCHNCCWYNNIVCANCGRASNFND